LHQVGDLFELNVKLRCQKVKMHLLRALRKKKKTFTVIREEDCSSQPFTASACHVRLDYLLDRIAGEVVDTAGRFCYTLQQTNGCDAPDVKS